MKYSHYIRKIYSVKPLILLFIIVIGSLASFVLLNTPAEARAVPASSINQFAINCNNIVDTYGKIETTLNVSAQGRYRLWARIKGTLPGADSFFVKIDGVCFVMGNNSNVSNWTWIDYVSGSNDMKLDLDVSSGDLKLEFFAREKGVQIDKVQLIGDTARCAEAYRTGENCIEPAIPPTTVKDVDILGLVENTTIHTPTIVQAVPHPSLETTSVKFYVDDVVVRTEDIEPYCMSGNTTSDCSAFDFTKLTEGEHTLKVEVISSNSETFTKSFKFTYMIISHSGPVVSEPPQTDEPTPTPTPTPVIDTTSPTVTVTAPTNNATVAGTVNIAANASDNVGVARVSFFLDGSTTAFSNDSTAPYSATLVSTSVANGTHTISAKAIDAAGNVTTSTPITINVQNVTLDTTKPTTQITAPANNATVSETITISASATDNIGVTKVDLIIDGTLAATDITSPYSFQLNTTILSEGNHIITTRAYDTANNMQISTPITINVDNIPPPLLLCQDATAYNVGQSLPCTYTTPPPNPPPAIPGDVTSDGTVNRDDLRQLIVNFNKTVTANTSGDVNGDGVVNRDDLRIIIINYDK